MILERQYPNCRPETSCKVCAPGGLCKSFLVKLKTAATSARMASSDESSVDDSSSEEESPGKPHSLLRTFRHNSNMKVTHCEGSSLLLLLILAILLLAVFFLLLLAGFLGGLFIIRVAFVRCEYHVQASILSRKSLHEL